MEGYVKIQDGSQWPDIFSEIYADIAYKLLHGAELTRYEKAYAGGAMESFRTLINHPAFTKEKCWTKIKGMRGNQ